ncbi:MAG: 2-C-methyl-D-erythritol 4-phosphate cytidylyltransferase, partial [Elusimicrobia bacterium]|nr:2-C-methyl-D-erythritol 4-phosphate cytidylyltransferase [Elusimicrobiota bacterium]
MDPSHLFHGRQPEHPPTGHDPHLWGIVLAAGDGKRVAHLTEKLAGRGCPKQYCTIIGKRSLLQHTLHRAERLIPPERILTVVSPAHRKEIHHQLADRPAGTL